MRGEQRDMFTMAIRKSSRDETVLRYFGFVCDSRLM